MTYTMWDRISGRIQNKVYVDMVHKFTFNQNLLDIFGS